MKLFSGIIVCASGFLGAMVVTEKYRRAIAMDFGLPLLRLFEPINALVSTGISRMLTPILLVLFICTRPKIFAAIIQSVFVFMIYVLAVVKKCAVHTHSFRTFVPKSVECFAVFIPPSSPIPLREKFKIACIDNGILSLCKRYESIRFGLWLNNRMSLNVPLVYSAWHPYIIARGFRGRY